MPERHTQFPRLIPARPPANVTQVLADPTEVSPSTRRATEELLQPPSSVVAWGWYVDGARQDCGDLGIATERAKNGEGYVWMGLKDPTNEDMTAFATQFDLHPLAIEDAVEGHTRSKVEQFDQTLFAVVSTVAYIDHETVTESSEIVSTGQIMVFVGPGFVMTVRRGEHAQLKDLRQRMEAEPERLAMGPAMVLYAVLDKVIDDYSRVVQAFEEDIDEVESAVFSQQGTKEIDRVYNLKRELIEFRRSVAPLSPPLLALATRPFVRVPEEMRPYFRELSDHLVETREAITSYDDVLSTILQAGLARASVDDNHDMRAMSAALAILVWPTTIGAIYGMNFDNMPELHYRWAYFIAVGVMLALMLLTYIYFRRRRWL